MKSEKMDMAKVLAILAQPKQRDRSGGPGAHGRETQA